MVLPERRNAKSTHERPLCAHFLRNTSGYIQRTKFGVGFELICKRFNHSAPITILLVELRIVLSEYVFENYTEQCISDFVFAHIGVWVDH